MGKKKTKTTAPETPLKFCYQCRTAPAAKIHIFAHRHSEAMVFCSVQCAAVFAFEKIMQSDITFCLEHGVWTNEAGGCEHCMRNLIQESRIKEARAQWRLLGPADRQEFLEHLGLTIGQVFGD